MRTVDQHLREPKQDGRFNRLMAFKRGTGGAWAMGGRAQEEVGLAGLRAFTGLLLAFRAARSLHQPPFSVCVCVCVEAGNHLNDNLRSGT